MRAWPNQVDAHDQRHGHAQENTEQRKPKILQADRFVMRAEEIAGDQARLWRFRGICPAAAIVGDHACE